MSSPPLLASDLGTTELSASDPEVSDTRRNQLSASDMSLQLKSPGSVLSVSELHREKELIFLESSTSSFD